MSNIIKGVASAMIIVLIVLLIWIFFAYYRNSAFLDTIVFPSGDMSASTLNIPSDEYISEEKKNIQSGLIESIIGEKDTQAKNESISGDVKEQNNSGDSEFIDKTTESGEDNTPNTIIEIPSKKDDATNPNEQILISSNLETSNQEKQEILSEIDEALQGLLEAVGKVETVDETRLDATLDSGVGEP